MAFWNWLTANPDALGKGEGLYGLTLFLIMFLIIAITVVFAFLFRKYPVFARRFIVVMAVIMIVSRLFRMFFRTIVLWHGAITVVEEIIPWHICHIMCFVLGFALIFNKDTKSRVNRIYITAISYYSLFGSVLTFLFGSYYEFAVLSFYDIESILLHIFLILGWLYFLLTRRLEYSYTAILCTLFGMFVIMGYAAIGNLLLSSANPDINNMYIRINGLPFSFFPDMHFLWTYAVLCVLVYGSFAAGLFIKRKFKLYKKLR
jgi:hypothetical protein